MRKIKKGFTLAEILVTLGVIGVIATITVPTLIQDVQDAQFKTAWKNSFQTMSQAAKRMAIDNASDLSGIFGSNIDNEDLMRNQLLKYLNYTKKCDSGALATNGCWHAFGKSYKFSGQTYHEDWNPYAGFIMNDGNLVMVNFRSIDCSSDYAANSDACGQIFVDVNGFSGPNRVGKDIYGMLLLRSGGVSPNGTQGDIYDNYPDTHSCSLADSDTTGWGCAADYLYQ